MKKQTASISVCTALALLLTGCSHLSGLSKGYTPVESSLDPAVAQSFREAAQIQELSQYMTNTSVYPLFSECPEDSGLLFYFDLLNGSDYFIVTQDDTDYLIYLYSHSAYGRVIDKLISVEKIYDNGTLTLQPDVTFKETNGRGCFPDYSYVRCILRLDEPVSSVRLGENTLSPYAGGFVHVGELVGAVDADLQIVLPVAYKGVYQLPTYDDDVPVMYRIWNEEGVGLIDEQFNEILPVSYSSVQYLSPDRYVITVREDGSNNPNTSRLGVIDGKGNLIYGYTDGMLFDDNNFRNYAHQAVYGIVRSPEPPLYGVIDAQMNVVIPPLYSDITAWSEENENQFYVVEQGEDNYAIFDATGAQVTDFQHSSVYEMQTAYHEKLRGTGTKK